MIVEVVSATAHPLRARVDDDIAMSFGALRHRSVMLVELESSNGEIGLGESWVNHPPWAYLERTATLEQGVLPLVLDRPIPDVSALHAELVGRLEPLGRQSGAIGPIWHAISGVDIALWDLCSRSEGRNLAEVLGGRNRESIPAYASSVGPRDVAGQTAACLARGLNRVKLRVGFGRRIDQQNLAAARAVLGESGELFVDANQAWSLEEAIDFSPLLSRYKVAWVEEPIRGNRLSDLEAFWRKTGVRIATGENLYGRDAFLPYAESKAVAVLQPDVSKSGGVTELVPICAAADACGKDVILHLYGGPIAYAASLQLAASCAAVRAVEFDVRENPLRDGLLEDVPPLSEGAVSIPTGPGIGVQLNRDALSNEAWRDGGLNGSRPATDRKPAPAPLA